MFVDTSINSLTQGTMRFGYASQNLTLGLTTGRTLRLAGLEDVDRVRAIVESNLDALEAILRWNAAHGIALFRMSQQLIPFASHPSFPYDWEEKHGARLREIGALASSVGVRLSMHPGQFIQPGSPNPDVHRRSIGELHYVARLLALLDASDLVLHLGGAFDDRNAAAARFITSLEAEGEILRFLALENDERIWTVEEVLDVAWRLQVPAIVDTLHHALNPGDLTLRQALEMALPSWRRPPKVHLSSQDATKQRGAHAWGVEPADLHYLEEALEGRDVDVMVEAKGKEQAVLPLLRATSGTTATRTGSGSHVRGTSG
jgi:UV DNA damage endonuclease